MYSILDIMFGFLYLQPMSLDDPAVCALPDGGTVEQTARDDRHSMTTGEQATWWALVLVPLASLGYLAVVIPQLVGTPVGEVQWQIPMIIAIAAAIAGTIIGTIVGAIIRAIVTRDTETGSDIRDAQIDRHGDRLAFMAAALGGIPILVLAMLELDPFWIGTAVFLTGAIGATVGAVSKIRAYRGGFVG